MFQYRLEPAPSMQCPGFRCPSGHGDRSTRRSPRHRQQACSTLGAKDEHGRDHWDALIRQRVRGCRSGRLGQHRCQPRRDRLELERRHQGRRRRGRRIGSKHLVGTFRHPGVRLHHDNGRWLFAGGDPSQKDEGLARPHRPTHDWHPTGSILYRTQFSHLRRREGRKSLRSPSSLTITGFPFLENVWFGSNALEVMFGT